MYLVITQYGHETGMEEIKTKKQVKEHIEKNKRDATWVGIYKVTKKLSVNEFEMIPADKEKQALKQARKLKAFRIRNSDNENTFSDVYAHIQHEVNLYDNNEENNQLTKSSADSAKVWLLRYAKLI